MLAPVAARAPGLVASGARQGQDARWWLAVSGTQSIECSALVSSPAGIAACEGCRDRKRVSMHTLRHCFARTCSSRRSISRVIRSCSGTKARDHLGIRSGQPQILREVVSHWRTMPTSFVGRRRDRVLALGIRGDLRVPGRTCAGVGRSTGARSAKVMSAIAQCRSGCSV